MRRAALDSDVDFDGFLREARTLLAEGVRPEEAEFDEAVQTDLFSGLPASSAGRGFEMSAPEAFLAEARWAAMHSAADRFDLAYRLLFRLQLRSALMEIESDPDVMRLRALAKAVRRDRHKMTAFVRFQEMGGNYIAWFEPDHRIEEHVAGFFVDRYAAMRFAIHTPRRAILWRDQRLSFGPGGKPSYFQEDSFSEAWNVYYRSTFNPARLNRSAMLKEMPRKYWANMPETRQIGRMIASAEDRMRAFEDTSAKPAARRIRKAELAEPLPEGGLEACRRCDLWRDATQAVPGLGPSDAAVIFVGEQPGDQEDLAGKPFVGPAGQVFNQALKAAGLDRGVCYITNAVKHFKHEPRGKRRIHKKPNDGEIAACRPWLTQELQSHPARIVVAIGATAYFALTGGRDFSKVRGGEMALPDGRRLIVTIHPSYLLRIPDEAMAERERQGFFAAIATAKSLLPHAG